MRCPFCGCGVTPVSTAELVVIENNVLRTPSLVVYDERVRHYRCENGHAFFACSEVRAEADSNSQRSAIRHNRRRKRLPI